MSPLEISANVANLLSVFLAARNHVLTWSIGILGSILYGVMFYQSRLCADVALQLFFIATSACGWWNWQRGSGGDSLPIQHAGRKRTFLFVVLGSISAALYGTALHLTTDAVFPFIDSVVLTFSIVAQFLLMRREIEHWIFWIIVDVVAIPLYATRELYLTSGVYAIFLVNAIWGLVSWRRMLKERASA